MDRCEICRFWLGDNLTDDGQKLTDSAILGFCRRFPPHKVYELNEEELEVYETLKRLKSARFRQIYPLTGDIDWCGEFKSK